MTTKTGTSRTLTFSGAEALVSDAALSERLQGRTHGAQRYHGKPDGHFWRPEGWCWAARRIVRDWQRPGAYVQRIDIGYAKGLGFTPCRYCFPETFEAMEQAEVKR